MALCYVSWFYRNHNFVNDNLHNHCDHHQKCYPCNHDDENKQVEEGTHHYKFLVDGHWCTEESEPTVANDLGNLWNMVQVMMIMMMKIKLIIMI